MCIISVPAVQMISCHKSKHPVLRLGMAQCFIVFKRKSELFPVRLTPCIMRHKEILLIIYCKEIPVLCHTVLNLTILRKKYIPGRRILFKTACRLFRYISCAFAFLMPRQHIAVLKNKAYGIVIRSFVRIIIIIILFR